MLQTHFCTSHTRRCAKLGSSEIVCYISQAWSLATLRVYAEASVVQEHPSQPLDLVNLRCNDLYYRILKAPPTKTE